MILQSSMSLSHLIVWNLKCCASKLFQTHFKIDKYVPKSVSAHECTARKRIPDMRIQYDNNAKIKRILACELWVLSVNYFHFCIKGDIIVAI